MNEITAISKSYNYSYYTHGIMLALNDHKLLLIATILLVITIGMSGVFFDDAFATIGAGKEYQPTQPNALASYSNSTNQVQVNWDFSAAGAPTTCFLKADIYYYPDLESSAAQPYTSIPSFTPIYYSPVTATPVKYGTGNGLVEIVDCTGSMRIDIATIMSHSTNVNNHPDLEIFLTFYVPDSNGNYNAGDQYRIDEVFVMYAPDKIFTQSTYQGYGCNGQIGSTLYIDGSGSGGSVIAYGDNGDNCGDHLYLQNNEYVNISPDDTDTSPADESGVVTKDTHVEASYPLWTEVNYAYAGDTGGSDCIGDCMAPLMGLAPNGNRVVDNGFSYNGHTVNVENVHTPFPLITTSIGHHNIIFVKAYDSQGLGGMRLVQLALGVPEINSPISLAEVILEFWIEYGGDQIEDIIITDRYDLIDNDSVHGETTMVDCMVGSETQCASIEMHYRYRQAPMHNTMAVMVMDIYKYSETTTINHGVEVIGDSLNPADTTTTHVSGELYPQKSGLVQLTQIDRSEQLWIDSYGYVWQGDDSKMVLLSDIPQRLPDDDSKSEFFGYNNRINSHFESYMQEQEDKATILFDSSLIQSELGSTFTHQFPHVENRMDSLAERMNAAEMLIIQAYEIKYPGVNRG